MARFLRSGRAWTACKVTGFGSPHHGRAHTSWRSCRYSCCRV